MHEVVAVPTVAHPHDGHAPRRVRRVERVPVPDVDVDVVDPAVIITVVEHEIAGLEPVEREVARTRHVRRGSLREGPARVRPWGRTRHAPPSFARSAHHTRPELEPGYRLAAESSGGVPQPLFTAPHVRVADVPHTPANDRSAARTHRRELDAVVLLAHPGGGAGRKRGGSMQRVGDLRSATRMRPSRAP